MAREKAEKKEKEKIAAREKAKKEALAKIRAARAQVEKERNEQIEREIWGQEASRAMKEASARQTKKLEDMFGSEARRKSDPVGAATETKLKLEAEKDRLKAERVRADNAESQALHDLKKTERARTRHHLVPAPHRK